MVKKASVSYPAPAHKENMHRKDSIKYLRNILSTKGGLDKTIEDRRNKGWGKITTIMGILSEVDMSINQLQAGLLLREAILISGMLFSAEAWSGITDKQLARMEVVDTSVLVRLAGGHTECGTEFNHLGAGTWMLCHHPTYLLYYQHILTRDREETMSKIYYKQKQKYNQGTSAQGCF